MHLKNRQIGNANKRPKGSYHKVRPHKHYMTLILDSNLFLLTASKAAMYIRNMLKPY